jgi:hypothetical protein
MLRSFLPKTIKMLAAALMTITVLAGSSWPNCNGHQGCSQHLDSFWQKAPEHCTQSALAEPAVSLV